LLCFLCIQPPETRVARSRAALTVARCAGFDPFYLGAEKARRSFFFRDFFAAAASRMPLWHVF
jgi:hypothetical protein